MLNKAMSPFLHTNFSTKLIFLMKKQKKSTNANVCKIVAISTIFQELLQISPKLRKRFTKIGVLDLCVLWIELVLSQKLLYFNVASRFFN